MNIINTVISIILEIIGIILICISLFGTKQEFSGGLNDYNRFRNKNMVLGICLMIFGIVVFVSVNFLENI